MTEIDTTAVHHPSGIGFCYTCGLHVDARVHHTPERIAGTVGPAIGATMAQNPLEQGAILIATTMKPPGSGFGPLQGIAAEAVRDLIAAGWTPPAREGDDETAKLRSELEAAYRQIEDQNRVIHRLSVEEFAAAAFRDRLVHEAFAGQRNEMQAQALKSDTEKRFTRFEMVELVKKVLAGCDRAAQSARNQRAKQGADWTAQTEKARRALIGDTAMSATPETEPEG